MKLYTKLGLAAAGGLVTGVAGTVVYNRYVRKSTADELRDVTAKIDDMASGIDKLRKAATKLDVQASNLELLTKDARELTQTMQKLVPTIQTTEAKVA